MKDYKKSLNFIDAHTVIKAKEDISKVADQLVEAHEYIMELVDKEKPMKAEKTTESAGWEDVTVDVIKCPKCGEEIWNDGTGLDEPDYCPKCGQHLDLEKEGKE